MFHMQSLGKWIVKRIEGGIKMLTKEAVEEFLKKHNNFKIDKNYNKLYVSYSPNGYLRRIK